MERKKLSQKRKRCYSRISVDKRQSFVNTIDQKGISVSKAAKKFKIKASTAKLIYKKYKQTGKFFPKRIQAPQKIIENMRQKSEDEGRLKSKESIAQSHQKLIQVAYDQMEQPPNQFRLPVELPYCFSFWTFPMLNFWHIDGS